MAGNQTLFKRVQCYGEAAGGGSNNTGATSSKGGAGNTFTEAATVKKRLNDTGPGGGGDSTTAAGSLIERAASHAADSVDSPLATNQLSRKVGRKAKGNSGTIDILA